MEAHFEDMMDGSFTPIKENQVTFESPMKGDDLEGNLSICSPF